jgi:hypothetical protein
MGTRRRLPRRFPPTHPGKRSKSNRLKLQANWPAMEIPDAGAVIVIAAGQTTTSEGATECKCTGGKRGTAESKGDCKNNHGLRLSLG